jgi:iron complex transport system substrate-binding protein
LTDRRDRTDRSDHPDHPDLGRRLVALGCLAAPLAVGAGLSRRVRAALVGAGGLDDGWVEPGGAAAGFPRTLHGPTGGTWTLPRPPRRIVSTYLGADEILAELVPPDRVVGVSFFADDPAISSCAGVYPAGVPRLRTQVETILALQPDLVCVAGFSEPNALRLMIGAGLPVLRWSRFETFADILANLRLLGAAVGADGRAAAIAGAVEATLGDLARRLAGVRRLPVLYYDPPSFTVGRDTLIDEIITRAGGANVAAAAGIRGPGQIGIEAVLGLDPEAIVVPRYGAGPPPIETLRATPLWRDVPAVRAGRVYQAPGAFMGDVSHHAVQGLARLARVLHPAAF